MRWVFESMLFGGEICFMVCIEKKCKRRVSNDSLDPCFVKDFLFFLFLFFA